MTSEAAAEHRLVRPADLSDLVELGSVRLAPDGRFVVAVATRLPVEANRVVRALVTGLVDGETLREGSPAGPAASESLPCWAPEARTGGGWLLAAVRSDDHTSRVVLRRVGADGMLVEDDVSELARFDDPVTELSWSPDGRWLLAVVRERRDRVRAELPDDRRPPLRLTRLRYRYDGVGYTIDRPQQAYLIPVAGGPPRKLSRGWHDDFGFSWRPDSGAVVFVSQRHSLRDRTILNDVFVQVFDDAEPRQLTRTEYAYEQPCFSPDATRIAAIATDVASFPSTGDLVVLDAEGGEVLWRSDALDRDCNGPTTDAQAPIWTDNHTILALVEDAGSIHAIEASTERTGPPGRVVAGERWITSLAAGPDGTLAFVAASPAGPPALIARAEDGSERVLYAPNEDYRERHDLRRPEHSTVETTPGVFVDTWLVLPDPARWHAPHALLVSMQGGGGQYGWHWSHESQTLCAAGFAVLTMNARGSGGYGKDWYRAVSGTQATTPGHGWGVDDISDMLAVVEATLERCDRLDPDRVGVFGGSYGALCVTWMLERSDRFRAGWAERGPYNLFSLAGTNDESPWFFTSYIGRNHLDDPEAYWAASPLRRVAEIEAPLMIVHSENDYRCPIGQAEELFMALKLLGRDVELVRFPGESHGLTRTGSPVHRLQRLELLVEWFSGWLEPRAAGTPASGESEAVGVPAGA